MTSSHSNHLGAPMSVRNAFRPYRSLLLIPLILGLTVSGMSSAAAQSVTVAASHPNVVSFWNDISNKTVLARTEVSTTPEEQRPAFFVDVATVHIAIYDTVVAIEGRFKPFAVKPKAPATGASTEVAVSAAAYGVLKALFPNRSAVYQVAYDQRLAAIPDGAPKTLGLALGREVAAEVVRIRANDGRSVTLAPYVSSTAPGKFRSANATPIFRHFP